MAVKLRLKRMGRKKRPFYRLVAIDSRKRRDGLEIERLGWYNPVQKDLSYDIKEDRVLYWLKEGAQPSDTVSGLFVNCLWENTFFSHVSSFGFRSVVYSHLVPTRLYNL